MPEEEKENTNESEEIVVNGEPEKNTEPELVSEPEPVSVQEEKKEEQEPVEEAKIEEVQNQDLDNKPEPEKIDEPVTPKEEIQIEKIGNKTIEKSGDTITITEVMTPPENKMPRGALDTKFPAPFRQNDLWQKFLTKLGERKRKKLDKIMNSLSKLNKVTNDEVEKLLHVSDATATRYLGQLEKEGKIKQVGKTGKYTYYEKI